MSITVWSQTSAGFRILFVLKASIVPETDCYRVCQTILLAEF